MTNHDRAETAIEQWGSAIVGPGEESEGHVIVSESYAGADIQIPIYVWRGEKPGPKVFVSAAVHGDEINGTGVIRHLIVDKPFDLAAGTLVLVPVVNIMGFERHSRYMPDRRDLNRSFPGTKDGSLTSRLAHTIFESIPKKCEYGIDLHTAAVRRTNFPNVRADMGDQKIADLARAFGTELIVSGKGPQGSFRRAACQSGCSTIILEAGEVWKVEPAVVAYAVRGIRNCLKALRMVEGIPEEPEYRIEVDKTKWVRATHGGFLRFHIAPGDVIERGDPIATNTSLTGKEQSVLTAPRGGVVLGMTTLPSVSPGDPVCHIAYSTRGALKEAQTALSMSDDSSLHQQIRDDLASSVNVVEPPQDPE
jgi:predicted deacylase